MNQLYTNDFPAAAGC